MKLTPGRYSIPQKAKLKNGVFYRPLIQERKNQLAQRKAQRTLKVHEKHTHTTRINELTARTRRAVLKDSQNDDDQNDDLVKDWTLETTKEHPFGKEGIVEYIDR